MEIQSLIRSMLEVDPLNRITIAEIRELPWFKKNLPPYLVKCLSAPQNSKISEISEPILVELAKVRELIITFLLSFNSAAQSDNEPSLIVLQTHEGDGEKPSPERGGGGE